MTRKLVAVPVAFAAAATLTLTASARAGGDDKVARGRYLVGIGGCNDCHTPHKVGPNGPEPDRSRLLSGHPEGMQMPPAPALPPGPWVFAGAGTMTAWSGPWGVSFTANLTPDQEAGLGRWTERDFVDTMRTGRHQGRGRALLPPMPYPNVAALTDADLSAVFAYLRSIPAIRNAVPAPLPPPVAAAPAAKP
jgi:mono/diheme cytochrome c family protein